MITQKVVALLSCIFFVFIHDDGQSKEELIPDTVKIQEKHSDQPASNILFPFVKNSGQFPQNVLFYSSNPWGGVWVAGNHDIVYSVAEKNKDKQGAEPSYELILTETLVGASKSAYSGKEHLKSSVSYLGGNDNGKLRKDIASYKGIQKNDLYDKIDLELMVQGSNVEKIFHVHPGGDPKNIQIRMDGVELLRINDHEELEAVLEEHVVRFTRPVAYQENQIAGKDIKEYVEVGYQITGNMYSFNVPVYDQSRRLIIDPLLASTTIGGNDDSFTHGAIAFDSKNDNVYIAGHTFSTNFPTTAGVYDITPNGDEDIFVACLSKDLKTLRHATYIGGSGQDWVQDIAIGQDGYLYLTGLSNSSDFPTTVTAYSRTMNGGSDAIILKVSPDLKTLVASTYLGGGGGSEERGSGIRLDANSNVYIVGTAESTGDFPTTPGAYDRTYNGGGHDVFVAQLDSDLTTLLASTLIGGADMEWPNRIMGNIKGDIYITGETRSSDFPTTHGAYDTNLNGDQDIFIARFDASLTTLINGTLFGGSSDGEEDLSEDVYGIVQGGDGDLYIAGNTRSPDFPVTAGAYDSTFSGGSDGFVARFSGDLSELRASTFLGGPKDDSVASVLRDVSGSIYVTGYTVGSFPTTTGGREATTGDTGDVFFSKMNSDLSSLLYSTVFGGSSMDAGGGINIDNGKNVYLTGVTDSADYPVTGATFGENNGGISQIFLTTFSPEFFWPMFFPAIMTRADQTQ